jgi:hypothetical protein
LSLTQRDNGKSFTVERDELNLESSRVVSEHDRAKVAGFQSILLQWIRQGDRVKFLDHRESPTAVAL